MKQFKVKIWVGSMQTYVYVSAANSAQALSITRQLYPMARISGVSTT